MASKVLILSVFLLGVNCDDLLNRLTRSVECGECQYNLASSAILPHPPPPPPPPPMQPPPPPPPQPQVWQAPPPPLPPSFHARQWTGLTTSPDGTPQGVFSGAQASLNAPTKNSGQAYSMAASTADDCQDSDKEQAGLHGSVGKTDNNSFKNGGAYNQNARASANSEAHSSADSSSANSGSSAQSSVDTQSSPAKMLRGDNAAQSHYDNSNPNIDVRKYDNEKSRQLASSTGDANKGSDVQSSVNGALHLAAQGLHAADQQKECSSCGRSNYAASNASSHSGDAVAISIGG